MAAERVKPDLQGQLICSGDIAERFGVGRAAVSNWKKRHASFPKPAYQGENAKVLLYWTDEIEAWMSDHFEILSIDADALERKAERLRKRAEWARGMEAK